MSDYTKDNEQLEEIASAVAQCERCPLAQTRTNTVPGYGDAAADIVFIGEGPGKNEDLQGVPFCGAAGRVLDELLDSINLKRENIFITNVVKCRPPKNRDPLQEEVDACFGFLRQQLAVIQPKIIVNLGRHSMDRFLPNCKISEDHGKPKRRTIENLGTFVFYPIYHPAAALYNPQLKEVLLEDIKRLPKIIEAIQQQDKNTRDDEKKGEE